MWLQHYYSVCESVRLRQSNFGAWASWNCVDDCFLLPLRGFCHLVIICSSPLPSSVSPPPDESVDELSDQIDQIQHQYRI